MSESLIKVPSAAVEVNIDGKLTAGRMYGTSVRDKGKAILVEVVLEGGRSTLVPWASVSTTDNVGLYLLGPEKKDPKEKKAEKV